MGRGKSMNSRRTFARRAAVVLMRRSVRIMPDIRAQWAAAMQNEMCLIENDKDALRWAIGCLRASYAEKIRSDYGGAMNRQKINRISAIAPVILSLLALLDIMIVVTTGWERHLKDEGAAAHIFQLLIVTQAPFVLAFFATANWGGRVMSIARPLAFQILAIGLAFGFVAFFRL
jgi:hypothetical protein